MNFEYKAVSFGLQESWSMVFENYVCDGLCVAFQCVSANIQFALFPKWNYLLNFKCENSYIVRFLKQSIDSLLISCFCTVAAPVTGLFSQIPHIFSEYTLELFIQ